MSESIVLGGGCFWCLEAAYSLVKGVESVRPGYSGGSADDASYYSVAGGKTGHIEVVQVTFDPKVISLEKILAIFWTIHDPTSLNRQGADAGTEYASAIFASDTRQLEKVTASRDEVQAQLDKPVVTQLRILDTFYEAEDEHHNFYQNNPNSGYCLAVIDPKLAELREHFGDLLRSDPL